MASRGSTFTSTISFGLLLRQLRKRAGMTQRDLAAALGYSNSLISSLEQGQRQPDLASVRFLFIPALGLQDDPVMAARFIESAAVARGEQRPAPSPVAIPPAPPTPAAQAANPYRLPALPVELVGRAALVNQLSNRLLGHGGRLLTLVGPPGVGKTTLALAVATRLHQHYGDGACFVPLAAVNDRKMMAATIVAAVAPGDPGTKSPEGQLVELLRHRALLLVLDNLEQISDAASLIAGVLAACPLVVILATSRERLHLRAEQRFKVPPLDLNDAVALFVQRAQAVRAEFHPTPDTYATIAAICKRLDCLPLAVELCAAQIEIRSPVHLLAQLQTHALDLLVDGAHDLASQHHTLRLALQRSYAVLTADEQRLLRGLGIFVGSFDLAAVAIICNHPDPGAIIHALIGKSLVRAETVTADEQRFSLLETIRAFALDQARTHGEEVQLRQRHYTTYLQRFRTADAHLRGPEVTRWFARLDPDYDNLRSAVNWALAAGHYADGAWLLIASSWYSRLRGQWYEEIGWFQTLLPHLDWLDPALRLAFLICFCSLARSPEEYETINSYATDLMALTQLCPDKVLGAGVWHFLAKAAPDFAQAASAWERSIALGRAALLVPPLGPEYGVAADPHFVLGGALDFYATRLIEQGAFAQAVPLIAEAQAIAIARGFQSGIGAALNNRGLLALLQGDPGQARLHLAAALAITTTSIFPAVRAKTTTLLGLTMLYHNNAREARRLLLAALALWTNIRDKPQLAIVAIYLAETALWERRTAEAEQWLAQGLREQVEPRWLGSAVVNCLHVAARLAVLREAYQWAATLFGLAEVSCARVHYTLVEPVSAQNRGALVRAQASLDLARFGAAFAAGQQMTVEEAFTILLTDVVPTLPGLSGAVP